MVRLNKKRAIIAIFITIFVCFFIVSSCAQKAIVVTENVKATVGLSHE